MSLCRSVIVLLALAGCPQHAPPEPPRDPPPTVGSAVEGGESGLKSPERVRPEEAPRSEAGAQGAAADPVPGASGGGEGLADVLAPRAHERRARAGGCQEGARQAGESWRVECNTCYCGADGQVTCTVMACNVQVGQAG